MVCARLVDLLSSVHYFFLWSFCKTSKVRHCASLQPFTHLSVVCAPVGTAICSFKVLVAHHCVVKVISPASQMCRKSILSTIRQREHFLPAVKEGSTSSSFWQVPHERRFPVSLPTTELRHRSCIA